MHDLFDPVYLQKLCRKYSLIPSKKYGQNFLVNPEPIQKMIEEGAVSKNDTIIEIGPGFGVLTQELSTHAGQVIAFEIEKRLQAYWEEQKKKYSNVDIVWGNILKQFNDHTIKKDYKVIANLPYQITSPVIRLFLECQNVPEVMVCMVQKEVAERICAKPGDMSLLSVAVQYYATPEYVLTVPRSYFWPEPGVDSALIKLTKHEKYDKQENELFFKVVKAGFSSRRKILIKNISEYFGKEHRVALENIFKNNGLLLTVRAQELSLEEWSVLVQQLAPIVHL
jgi:16S rRNA (adenine1518-N6/adenine1519-N6)-dimethyltransferase